MLHGQLIAPDESSFAFDAATPVGRIDAGETDHITVPDAHLLFTAAFSRAGDDLRLVGEDGKSLLIAGYFKGEKHATLLSPEGAALTADIVEALAGPRSPGHYAQAGSPQPAAQAIGRVATVSGNASVVRNGVTITLNVGDAVLKGDVVQTGAGGALGLIFNDGSTFTLSANARMVLNEFVYDPNGGGNASLVNLVQGSLSFVAGQVAKTGDMKIGTPVATMGIRGTMGTIVESFDGQVTFSIHEEGDGNVHVGEVRDAAGNLLFRVTSNGGQWTVRPVGPLQVIAEETGKTPEQLQQELQIVQQLLNTQGIGQQLLNQLNPPDQNPNNPNPQKSGSNGTTIVPSDNAKLTIDFNVTTTQNGDGSKTTTYTYNSENSGNGGNNGPDNSNPPDTSGPSQPLSSNLPPVFEVAEKITRVGAGEEHSFGPRLSADGQKMVFGVSSDLPGGNSGATDMRIYDATSGTTKSMLAHLAEGTTLHDGEVFDALASISADGRYVVFKGEYPVTNGDFTGTMSEVFLYDSVTDTTRLLAANASQPAISADGNVIAVEMFVPIRNLVAFNEGPGIGGRGGYTAIALLDREGDVLAVIEGPNGADARNPALSADGNFITFWSADPNDPGAAAQVYIYDRAHDHLELVSHNLEGGPGDGNSGALDYVGGENGGGEQSWASAISADGHWVVFQSNADDLVAGDNNGHSDIFLYDTTTGAITRVSVDLSDDPSKWGDSIRPEISGDGRYILFISSAADLVAGDSNGQPDVFLYDRLTGKTTLVSANVAGIEGNGDSEWGASISYDGKIIAFGSQATNLATGTDTNGSHSDIFIVDNTNATQVTLAADDGLSALTASGELAFDDTDDTHHTVSFANVTGATNWGALTAILLSDTANANTPGKIGWSYSVNESLAHTLAPGETHTDKFLVTVTDAAGNSDTQEIDVTVVGVDHAPHYATQDTTIAFTENAGVTGDSTPHVSAGTLFFSDADANETAAAYSVSVVDVSVYGYDAGLPDHDTLLSFLKPFSIVKDAGATTGSTPGEFSAPDSAFDYLAAGQTVVLNYTVRLQDGSGYTDHVIPVVITGTNDAPVITGVTTTPSHGSPVYMTGTSNPWGVDPSAPGSPESAMDAAFGAGNWTKMQGFTADVFDGTHAFIYIDGGDGISYQFNQFISDNVQLIENFVANGGHLFINAARWTDDANPDSYNGGSLYLGFGATLEFTSNYSLASSVGYAVDPNHPIFLGPNGSAGVSWYGNYFSHDIILGESLTALITSGPDGTGYVLLGEESYGRGLVLFGGMTDPSFQGPQPDADNLRANIISYAADGAIGAGSGTAASGAISFHDPDLSDTHVASVTPEGDDYIGAFKLGPVSEANGNGSVAWHFTVSDETVQSLTQTVTQTYDVKIDDQHGGVATQAISVSVGTIQSDTFVFQPGMGLDVIANFGTGPGNTDHLDLSAFNMTEQEALALAQPGGVNGQDTVIHLNGHDTIVIAGVDLQHLQNALNNAA
jgi:VCBS repeat-containing protein